MHQPGVPAQQRVERGAVTLRGGRGERFVAIVGLHRGQRYQLEAVSADVGVSLRARSR